MHELSIAVSLVEQATAEARRLGEDRIVAVHIHLGPLSGVVKEALLTAYEMAREGTPLADSRLVIEETPILIECPNCQQQTEAESIQSLVCSVCSTPAVAIVGGRELEIIALEAPS